MRTLLCLLCLGWAFSAWAVKTGNPCRQYETLGQANSARKIDAWSVEAGNLRLHPEDLVPPDQLAILQREGNVTVRMTKTPMDALPGIPSGLTGERVELWAGDRKVLSFTLGDNPAEKGIFYISEFHYNEPGWEGSADGIKKYLGTMQHVLGRIDAMVLAAGGTEYRIPGAADHPTWTLLQQALRFEPATEKARQTAELLREIERIATHEFPEGWRFTDPSDFDNGLGAFNRPALTDDARHTYNEYRRTGKTDDSTEIHQDSAGRDVLMVIHYHTGDQWFLIDPHTKKLMEWTELFREGGLTLRRKARLPNGLVELTREEADRLAAHYAAARLPDEEAPAGPTALVPRDPMRIEPWKIKEGNVQLTPEQLLPADYLAALRAEYDDVTVTVKPSQMTTPHPVAGFPAAGLPAHTVTIKAGKHVVATFTFAADPKDSKAAYIEQLNIEDPLSEKDGNVLQSAKGAPPEVYRRISDRIDDMMRAAGVKKIRTTGPGSYLVYQLHNRTGGLRLSSKEGQQIVDDLRAIYSNVRPGRPEGPSDFSLQDLSVCLGSQSHPSPSAESQDLWQTIRRTGVTPINVQIIRDQEGHPILMIERRRSGKIHNFINWRDPKQRLFDWNDMHQRGLLFMERDIP